MVMRSPAEGSPSALQSLAMFFQQDLFQVLIGDGVEVSPPAS